MSDEQKKRIDEFINTFFRGEYGDDVKEQFQDYFGYWLLDSHDSPEKEKAIEAIWDNLDPKPDAKTYKALKRFEQERRSAIPVRQRETFRKIITRVAAVLIPAMILLGGVYYLADRGGNNISGGDVIAVNNGHVKIEELTVPKAERKDVVLDDGTKITVNSGSKITYQEKTSADERVVELEGESYFSVAKNEQKPFVVKTKELSVTVLGTEFNVEAYPDRDVTIVTLNSGKISVNTHNNGTYVLEPNQQLIYTHSSGEAEIINLDKATTEEIASWKHGGLSIRGMSIYDIAQMVERNYNISVKLDDTFSRNQTYSATFDSNASLEQVMTVLHTIVPGLEYSIDDSTVRIEKKN